MFEVKHIDTLGYAGFCEDNRLTDYYQTKAEADFFLNRLIAKCKKEQEEWEKKVYASYETERKVQKFLAYLYKKKIARGIDKKTYFNRKQFVAMVMSEKGNYD